MLLARRLSAAARLPLATSSAGAVASTLALVAFPKITVASSATTTSLLPVPLRLTPTARSALSAAWGLRFGRSWSCSISRVTCLVWSCWESGLLWLLRLEGGTRISWRIAAFLFALGVS